MSKVILEIGYDYHSKVEFDTGKFECQLRDGVTTETFVKLTREDKDLTDEEIKQKQQFMNRLKSFLCLWIKRQKRFTKIKYVTHYEEE